MRKTLLSPLGSDRWLEVSSVYVREGYYDLNVNAYFHIRNLAYGIRGAQVADWFDW